MTEKVYYKSLIFKGILILFLALLSRFPAASQAESGHASLSGMLLESEMIVWGEIISMDYNSLLIRVHESFKGEPASDTIEVNKLSCIGPGKRWKDYETGQNSIFFLDLDKQSTHESWNFHGLKNSSEMPLEGGRAYICDSFFNEDTLMNMPTYKALYERNFELLDTARTKTIEEIEDAVCPKAYGKPYCGLIYNFSLMRSMITDYLSYFEIDTTNGRNIILKAGKQKLLEFARQSDLHAYLLNETLTEAGIELRKLR